MSAIVLAVVAAIAGMVLPGHPKEMDTYPAQDIKTPFYHYIVRLDLLGSVTGVLGLVLFNFAWNQAVLTGWQAPRMSQRTLFIPREAFNHDTVFVLGCIACAWGTFGIWIYYIWQYFEVGRELPPLLACAWKSPVTLMGFVTALSTAYILNKIHPSWVIVLAMIATIVGTVLPATAPEDQIYWAQTFVTLVIMPWGMDMSFPAAALQLSDRVSKEHQGFSANLVNIVVNYSISLALGIGGTVEREVSKGLSGREKVLKDYHGAWYFGIRLFVLGLALSLCFIAMRYYRGRIVREKEQQPQVAAN